MHYIREKEAGMNKEILTARRNRLRRSAQALLGDEDCNTECHGFCTDDVARRAEAAFDSNDKKTLLGAVHEAKSSSGSAGLKNVYPLACEVVDMLRHGGYTDEQLRDSFAHFEIAYREAQLAVKEALD